MLELHRPSPAPAAHRNATSGSLSLVVYSVIVGSLCLFITLTAIWARLSVDSVIRARADDMTPRIALKTSVRDERARDIAARLQSETPGLRVTVITHEDAGTLLALQEPWIKSLPQIEIGKLPAILTIHHPALLESPQAVSAFMDKAAQMPETDFVVFNTNGYEQFVRACQNARAYARLFVRLLVLASLVIFIVCHTAISRGRNTRGLTAAILSGAAIGILSSISAVVMHYGVQAIAAHVYYPLPTVPGVYSGIIAALATALCVFIEIASELRSATRL